MAYPEKLQKLCAMRNVDQATLASKVGLSKSSISRILSGVQEPKLSLAHELARALGVTLDYLVEDAPENVLAQHLVSVTEEELMILRIVRRLGANAAIDRLLNVAAPVHADDLRAPSVIGSRGRHESARFDASRGDPSDE
jgi:transcriptional regulator with XRE-family HTH domain